MSQYSGSKWSDDYTDLGVIEGILRQRLYSRRYQENFEDGIQQGLYHAWKDQQTGTFTEMHVINRAENWSRTFFQKPWLPLGHTRPAGNGGFTEEGVCLVPIADQAEVADVSAKLARATTVCEEDGIVDHVAVEALLYELPADYADALRMRFLEDATLEEVGLHYRPSSKSPRQKGASILKAALKEAKQVMGACA